MSDYKLTRMDKKFIFGLSNYFSLNPEEVSPDKINKENNTKVQRKLARKYLLKSSDNVFMQTFVIPVSEGAVTGYLFTNRKIGDLSGVSSLIVYFHGGGWVYGNMDFYSIYLKHLAEETEANILLVDYHLAPKYKFPTAVEDCYDAFVWASGGAKYWKVDPDRIYVAGDGAGANLAAVVSILARDRKGPPIAGQILLYPVVDCRLRTNSMITYKDSPTLNEKMLTYYIMSYAREPKDILSPMFSPLLSQDLTRLPNALIIAAEYDPLTDDAMLYEKALNNAGGKAKLLIAKQSFNGFMPFKHAQGRKEAESAIWQFTNGRSLEHTKLVQKKELKAIKYEKPIISKEADDKEDKKIKAEKPTEEQ